MANIYSLLFGGIGKVGKGVYRGAAAGIGAKMAIGAGVGAIYGASGNQSASNAVEGALKGAILGAGIGGMISTAPRAIFGSKGADIAVRRSPREMTFLNRLRTTKQALSSKKLPPVPTHRMVPGERTGGLLEAAWSNKANIMSSVGTIGKKAGNISMSIMNNPLAVAGIAGGIYAGASIVEKAGEMGGAIQSSESPYMTGRIGASMTYNKQALAAQRLGQIGGGTIGPPSMMQDRFEYAKWLSQAGMTALGVTKTGRLIDSTVGLPFGMHNGRHG